MVRVTKHWRGFPREAVESPLLEILKTQLDTISCVNGSRWPCLKRGVRADDLKRSLP